MKNPNAIIFHIDVNSAFLSWSALKLLREGAEVDIREIPSIVGGDQKTRHGIVVAKSIPAKRYGIQTAETVASALRKCPDLVMVRPEHSYYREESHKLMKYLAGICPVIQQVSVDECYMDFEPIRRRYSSPEECARKICDGVRDTFGFTVNVGISDRKILAKMASDFEKPDKVHTLYAHEIQEKLWPLPIGELHMCGKSAAERLRTMGVNTIGDLARLDQALAESWLKKQGTMLWRFANGFDDRGVEAEPAKAKGIGNSTTLSENALTAEDAYPVIEKLCDKVAERLDKQDVLAGSICTEIKYATFQSVSHQMVLKTETANPEKLKKYACQLFDEIWNGDPIRLLGVRTTKLVEREAPVQLNLFDFQEQLMKEREEKERLERERKAEEERLEREWKTEEERREKERKALEKEEQKRRKKESMDAAMESIKKRFGENAIHKGV